MNEIKWWQFICLFISSILVWFLFCGCCAGLPHSDWLIHTNLIRKADPTEIFIVKKVSFSKGGSGKACWSHYHLELQGELTHTLFKISENRFDIKWSEIKEGDRIHLTWEWFNGRYKPVIQPLNTSF